MSLIRLQPQPLVSRHSSGGWDAFSTSRSLHACASLNLLPRPTRTEARTEARTPTTLLLNMSYQGTEQSELEPVDTRFVSAVRRTCFDLRRGRGFHLRALRVSCACFDFNETRQRNTPEPLLAPTQSLALGTYQQTHQPPCHLPVSFKARLMRTPQLWAEVSPRPAGGRGCACWLGSARPSRSVGSSVRWHSRYVDDQRM